MSLMSFACHSYREPPVCASLEARQVRITGTAREAVRKGPSSNWLVGSNWLVISNGLVASKCFVWWSHMNLDFYVDVDNIYIYIYYSRRNIYIYIYIYMNIYIYICIYINYIYRWIYEYIHKCTCHTCRWCRSSMSFMSWAPNVRITGGVVSAHHWRGARSCAQRSWF